MFAAMLLMYLQSMGSVLSLIRFLRSDSDWLVLLNLRKKVEGAMTYKIPDRTTFYKFAERLGPDKITGVFAVMVVRLMQAGIITGEKISLDSSIIWAWFMTTDDAGITERGTGTRPGPGTTTARRTSSASRSTSPSIPCQASR